MKILLIGEYSRLHNSLKEGLLALGHEVTTVGTGDHFKNFPIDLSISPRTIASSKWFSLAHKIVYKFSGINLMQIEKSKRFKRLLPELKGYDVVQLINSDALEISPKTQIRFYTELFQNNKKNFLLVCGEDTPVITAFLKGTLKYSILTPYLENPELKAFYGFSLKYVTKPYRALYDFVASDCDGIIASDFDYKIPMEQTETPFTFIPNPINVDKIKFIPNIISDKITIFHGVNTLNALKKGNLFFEEALAFIGQKYADKVEIISASNLPYDQYITVYDKAHILLDQVYSYDQGYNALEAMAKGKVVFTGAEAEFTNYYQLSEPVNINALPNVQSIVDALSHLIEHPEEITAISNRARQFIEKEHHYKIIAQKYLDTWK